MCIPSTFTSSEANVLNGFERSSNCTFVKNRVFWLRARLPKNGDLFQEEFIPWVYSISYVRLLT
jgi:hypothetical protein